MEEEVIRIEDIVHALKERWKLIAIITLTATLLSGIVSFFIIKPQYEVSTRVFIGKEESATSEYTNNDIQMYQKLMKTYSEIIKTKDLVGDAIKGKKVEATTGDILRSLTVTPGADSQILQIKYTSTNKEEALKIVEAITNEFIDKSKELIPNGNVQVIEKAQLPEKPVSPNKKMNIAIAFLLGLMVSVGIVFLMEYMNNTFKTREDLENVLGLPVIGVIPDTEEA